MRLSIAVAVILSAIEPQAARAQTDVIPHAQDHPPGPALSPAEAIRRMQVPPGFKVELVASEPDIVNPVAMTFDERGRAWITESLEYPRREPGPGRDRVKLLEDTDGDGKADKFTVFAEGLNMPSGIAVGHGGVWVANSPDILFLQDTDGDGKADKREVVVSGFGRDDTHELPNSLTWGPDGWLYGWNGVFNRSRVEYRGKTHEFTCAIFRIHPVTREFEVFCEGTSNPWGIAVDHDGSLFASACVIDHLWHLVETGYYHRQGGPYPPFTWKIDSIVDHKHQKAAYCGIHYYDSDAYPPEYRNRLYMGNIHGNCINVDSLERDGSTYRAQAAPDFLTANDAWFMPVVQKTGPDGCLYILDWYDRYHCYQDANRDPAGIDRLKGRLYRVRYKDAPRRFGFDLAREPDSRLVKSLASDNGYDRDIARRLLTERLLQGRAEPSTRPDLERQSLAVEQGRTAKHCLQTLVGAGPLPRNFHVNLLAHAAPAVRAWAVRAAGDMKHLDPTIRARIVALADDASPDVRLQVAIAAPKLEGVDPLPTLLTVLSGSGDDPLIPHIVWQNLHPLLEDRADAFLALIQRDELRKHPSLARIMPRVIERIVGRRHPDPTPILALFGLLAEGPRADLAAAGNCLTMLAHKVEDGELSGEPLKSVRDRLDPKLAKILAGPSDGPLFADAALLATAWKDPAGVSATRALLVSSTRPEHRRLEALDALISARDVTVLDIAARVIADPTAGSRDLRGRVLGALDRLDDPRVATVVLAAYGRLEPELKPKAAELLTQRPAWAKALLEAIGRKAIPENALNVTQVRTLLGSKDAELVKLVRSHWGTVRAGRDPAREAVVAEMRDLVRKTHGDPVAGRAAFEKVCAQCHVIYGAGQDVGPDITSNGRGSFEQLLSNVFDPSLVIGASYQATTVATQDGRVLTGLLAEDSPQRVVLKLQGGKVETVPRADVEAIKTAELSLMPEEIEKQLTPREWADLFAFLTLDRPPGDPAAKPLPGSPVRVGSPARTRGEEQKGTRSNDE
jgi:putative membrane-bound dehydrogenase-like protein